MEGSRLTSRTAASPRERGDHRTPNALPYQPVTLGTDHTLGGHQRLMSSILRQFRGLGIALAVLAISAGAAFAAAPSLQLTSNHGTTHPAVDAPGSVDPSESAEPSASAEATESPEPRDSAERSESAQAASSVSPKGSPSPSDTHGALVSTAAQMPTPSGFPNHGAFVSCVAHLGVSPTTVTPQSCGITPAASAQPNAGQGHGHGNGHGNNGHGHGATGH